MAVQSEPGQKQDGPRSDEFAPNDVGVIVNAEAAIAFASDPYPEHGGSVWPKQDSPPLDSLSSLGDRYDNALVGTINGHHQAEQLRRQGHRNPEAVELAALKSVHWFNRARPPAPIAYIPAAEAEANYWRDIAGNPIANAA